MRTTWINWTNWTTLTTWTTLITWANLTTLSTLITSPPGPPLGHLDHPDHMDYLDHQENHNQVSHRRLRLIMKIDLEFTLFTLSCLKEALKLNLLYPRCFFHPVSGRYPNLYLFLFFLSSSLPLKLNHFNSSLLVIKYQGGVFAEYSLVAPLPLCHFIAVIYWSSEPRQC